MLQDDDINLRYITLIQEGDLESKLSIFVTDEGIQTIPDNEQIEIVKSLLGVVMIITYYKK